MGAVLSHFVDTATTPPTLIRPLLVAALLGAALIGAIWLVARDWKWTSIIGAAVALFTFRLTILALAIIAFCLWWGLVRATRALRGGPPPPPAAPLMAVRSVGIFAAVYLVMMGWAAAGTVVGVPTFTRPDYGVSGTGGPNIYIVMLDGYPRADTLAERFGYDNSPFFDELESAGYTIAPHARANFNKTWTSVASMLNGEYVDRMLPSRPTPADPSEQLRWLHTTIDQASMLDVLRERGYVTRTVAAPFVSTSLTSVDDYRDGGFVNEFEAKLIAASPWTLLIRDAFVGWLRSNQRDSVQFALRSVAEMAEEAGDRPQFVYAHVHSPHAPFVLPEETQDATAPHCFPLTCSFWNVTVEELGIDIAEYRRGLLEQITELNDLVVAATSEIAKADPDAVVIVMSDHGTRYSTADVAEHYRTLFAYRAPRVAKLFSEDVSPVNVLRVVAAEYFGTDTPELPYEAWISDWRSYLPIRRLGDTTGGS